jgi:hypothetical protein
VHGSRLRRIGYTRDDSFMNDKPADEAARSQLFVKKLIETRLNPF